MKNIITWFKQVSNRIQIWQIWCLLVTMVVLLSCSEDASFAPEKAGMPVLSPSSTTLQLSQKDGAKTALSFTWTSGSNHGTGTAISYSFQVDKKGNDFAAPKAYDLGQVKYTFSFTTSSLNDILLNNFEVPAGVSSDLEFRVKSLSLADGASPDYSNVAAVSVTPFMPVSSTLYLVGDATANGWDNTKATPLTPKSDDPTTFTYQGSLSAGELKMLTTLGQWAPAYQKGADDTHIVYNADGSLPDTKFTISQAGIYSVVVNLLDLTIAITKLDQPPYSKLWIVGDATPNGWTIDSPNEMQQSSVDPFVFTYNEVLKVGDFKIAAGLGNWCGNWIRPLTNHPDISVTTAEMNAGCDVDNKWTIPTAGAYKITINLRDVTISIQPFTPSTQLWMIGDAGPNGWNIDSPATTMTVDPGDANVYTYTGALSVGEFKIALGTGDWCGNWIRPLTNHPDLTDTGLAFNSGCSVDNKWQITTAGNYKVTVNQLHETITIVSQ